ncbi:MAG: hypothetical protein E7422_02900 [Ruminococcaceae bacterium]|nr:hypothetical protein [Oscillospiraceae bacterium]
MFEKRVYLFKKRDRETWQQIKAALKDAGLRGVRSGHYLQDVVMAGGCGAKLDPRDFGARGKIDHDIYWVKVPEDDLGRAQDILRQNGIVAAVEDERDLMTDAALRKSAVDKYYP